MLKFAMTNTKNGSKSIEETLSHRHNMLPVASSSGFKMKILINTARNLKRLYLYCTSDTPCGFSSCALCTTCKLTHIPYKLTVIHKMWNAQIWTHTPSVRKTGYKHKNSRTCCWHYTLKLKKYVPKWFFSPNLSYTPAPLRSPSCDAIF